MSEDPRMPGFGVASEHEDEHEDEDERESTSEDRCDPDGKWQSVKREPDGAARSVKRRRDR